MAGLLVLGATGLLGRAVVDEARRAGDSPVTGVGGVAHGGGDVELDLSTASVATVAELLADVGPSAIINCAGRTAGDRESLARANVMIVGVLLEALGRWGGSARLVHVGSAAEYAASETGVDTREDDPLDPQTAYAVTKAAGSRLVQLSGHDGEVDGVVARVFNPLGAGMPPSSMPGNAARLIGRAAADGLDTVAMGPLETYRDFVDTRDVAAALLLLARADRLEHRTFNVGSGIARQAREIVHQVAAAVGYGGAVVETASASPRSGHVRWQRADVSRLTAMGWHTNHDLSSSISALVASVTPGPVPGPGP